MIATCGSGITAAAGTGIAHHLFVKLLTLNKSLPEGKHFEFPYHTFVHCKVFVAAAPLRARALISVPFSGLGLSSPLRIRGLVSHYLANYLIRHRLILQHCFSGKKHSSRISLSSFILSFPRLSQTVRQIIDVLLSLVPVSCEARLAWLIRIQIAATSRRINGNYIWPLINITLSLQLIHTKSDSIILF